VGAATVALGRRRQDAPPPTGRRSAGAARQLAGRADWRRALVQASLESAQLGRSSAPSN